MKPPFRTIRLLLHAVPMLAASLLGVRTAVAQANSLIPLPFVSTIAGLAAGSGNTQCSDGITNQSGQSLGDNCAPSQATLVSLYDVQTDADGNIYTSENGTSNDIRVIYKGGATLAAALIASNADTPGFTPVAGRIYTLAGGTASALTSVDKVYYCGNLTGGPEALDSAGNGCPAALAYLKPRGFTIDQYGNIFTTNTGAGNNVRVIYAGGAQVATLIETENPGVVTAAKPPQVGYIYKIGGLTSSAYSGDGGLASAAGFVTLRYIAVDRRGNLFVSDGNTQSTSGGTTIEAAANNVRRIDGVTGIITTIAGENSCTYTSTAGCPYGTSADGVAGSGALLSTPYALFVDGPGNVYIADYYNAKIRVIYYGGTITGVTNPQVGYIYTYAGGGTATANGTVASQVKFGSLYVAGIDKGGNIYAEDGSSKIIWKFDAVTAIGYVLAGGASTSGVAKSGFSCSTPAAATPAPDSTDNFGDGCPGPQANFSDMGTIASDPYGNFYVAENGNGIVRGLSYNNQFGVAPDGVAVSQPLAFETVAVATLTGEHFTLQGASTAEYTDAGSDTCAVSGALAVKKICVYNVAFNPAHAGQRQGSLQFSTATGVSVSELLTGTGLASDIAIDPGTQSTLGVALTPSGIAADLLGNVYVADSTGNQVLKGASSGNTLLPLITGLNKPSGIAVDGLGNIYVADTGNNRVLETTATGITVTSLGSGFSGPQGVAVDGLGNIYVADTGNSRILQVFANGNQTPLPVTGLSAPTQLGLDSAGDLFIVDSGNKRIVEYGSTGQSTLTLDSGITPSGVTVDPAGTVYVTDSTGLRVVSYPSGATSGDTLLLGLTTPVALASDPDANLFVADSGFTGAIELRRSLGNVVFPLTNVGQTVNEPITVSNVGNAALTFSTPLATATGSSTFTVAPSSGNGCAAGASYAAGGGCNFTASFTPLATGSFTATVEFDSNATNTGSASALLSGQGLQLISTTTALNVISPPGTIYYGQPVTLTATLTSNATTTTPTGTFTFTIDGKNQSPQPIGNGTATLTLTVLQPGPHSISVMYSGDSTYASSAGTADFAVNIAFTATNLTVASVNTNGALSLLFTANVTSTTATGETGTVSFYAGTVLLGTVPLNISTANGSGVATYTTSTLSYATNSFTAVYNGNADFAGSTSAAVTSVGDFGLGYTTTAVATSQGGVASLSFTVVPLFSNMGTVTPSCSGLPANSGCRFQPGTIAVGSATQTETILIYTNVQSNLASNERSGTARGIAFALVLPLGLGLVLLRRRSKLDLLGMLVVGLVLTTGLAGCSKSASASSSQYVTPPGVYNIGIVFTGSAGLNSTYTIPVTFTVVADSGPF